jgi:hypothetical protein
MGKHARREPEPPHEQPEHPWPGPPQDPWAGVAPHPPLDGWPHPPAPHPAEPVSPPAPPAAAGPVSPPAPAAPPVFARASAPVGRSGPLRQPTAELPAVRPRTAPERVPGLRQPLRPSLRQLTFGWPMSVTGLFVAFIGWGVWAASVRGATRLAPILDFVIVLVVAVGLFAVSRLLGRHLMENLLRRPRRSARLAHAITGLFLCAAGVSFLSQTSWVIDGVNWLRGFR